MNFTIVRLNEFNRIVEEVAMINALRKELSERTKDIDFNGLCNAVRFSRLWLAIDDTLIIGMATLVPAYTLDGTEGHVEGVVVTESYRGQGVSKAIMKALMNDATSLHMTHLHLTSRPSRVAANKLYQSLGFEQRDTNTYRLKL